MSDAIITEASALRRSAEAGQSWLTNLAYPLWLNHGFDRETDSFVEQLDFDGLPLMAVPRRLMVQARHISVFAQAALAGDFPAGGDFAIAAGRQMLARYLKADGSAGWVFSINRDGRVVDATRDLYAHAFALFALAWLMRLEPSSALLAAIDESLGFLDVAFADPDHGGYWDSLPRKDALRRQNPHMHLFEALIELHQATGDEAILDRCRTLDALARTRLRGIDGALLEYFHDDWSVHPSSGQGSVEPGHQFEWAWLWRRYEAISGEDRSPIVRALLSQALRGTDVANGRIIDECGEDGTALKPSSRSWPHAEAMKALALEINRGDIDWIPLLARVSDRLLSRYCRVQLNGGWLDHLDADDRPLSKVMPASSLYHLSFGIRAIQSLRLPA